MFLEIWEKIKAAAQWVWNWVTVLTATLVGLPDLVLGLLNAIAGVDISPLVGPGMAVKIIAAVALAKAILTLIVTKGQVKQP